MDILKKIQECAKQNPQRIAFRRGCEDAISYGTLWEYSERLAAWLLEHADEDRTPVAVYGHKHPWMLVCFLACVKSGRAYCPIDISVPDARVEATLAALPSKYVLATEELHADAGEKQVLGLSALERILFDAQDLSNNAERGVSAASEEKGDTVLKAEDERLPAAVSEENWVHGNETYYIIFTSGSTGTPKGVQITADCLNYYLDWSTGLGSSPEAKQGQVFLNQAPFSFDLSVMDLYTSLATGGTLYCLEKSVQGDYRALLQGLAASKAQVWVSTPSFADVCLSDKNFGQELLPELEVFLFCGETLTNKTARKLQERFPGAKVINTYGPTESTVAVTDVLVTQELATQEEPLPVGSPKPGTRIEIWDEDGAALPEGEKGEIIILGDTVSTGYYGRADLTEKSFFVSGDGTRGYHTGDKGYMKNGMLYYCGRIDLQIKLHGYRIELEDVESNISKLPQVEHAVVVPGMRGGKVSSLTAYIVKRVTEADGESDSGEKSTNTADETAKLLGAEREDYDFTIPKKIVFLDELPMTNNGKVNRKRLAQEGVSGRKISCVQTDKAVSAKNSEVQKSGGTVG